MNGFTATGAPDCVSRTPNVVVRQGTQTPGSSLVSCDPGEKVVGGGFTGGSTSTVTYLSRPSAAGELEPDATHPVVGWKTDTSSGTTKPWVLCMQ